MRSRNSRRSQRIPKARESSAIDGARAEALAILDVARIVERTVRSKLGDQLLRRCCLQLGAARGVRRSGQKLVVLQDRAQVEPGAAAQHREAASRMDLSDGGDAIPLELVEVVFVAGVDNVDEVASDREAIDPVILQVLPGPDVHVPVDLTGVGADYLSVRRRGHVGRETSLSGRGGPEDANQRDR
jgi:hypothetical protein